MKFDQLTDEAILISYPPSKEQFINAFKTLVLLDETRDRVEDSLINYFSNNEVVGILESIVDLNPLDKLVKENENR